MYTLYTLYTLCTNYALKRAPGRQKHNNPNVTTHKLQHSITTLDTSSHVVTISVTCVRYTPGGATIGLSQRYRFYMFRPSNSGPSISIRQTD